MPAPTREMLLATALELFGRHGYDAVSVRMLARHAGANVASIKYHFGGKDDLYAACIEHIIALVAPRVVLLEAIAAEARELAGDDPARRRTLVARIVETALDTFLANPEVRPIVPLVLRELAVPGPHFQRLYDGVFCKVHQTMTAVTGWALGRSPDAAGTVVRAHAVLGQVVIFHIAREILARRLGMADYGPRAMRLIKQEATASVLASLGLAT
jgi:AcrR family transcriptional regulator